MPSLLRTPWIGVFLLLVASSCASAPSTPAEIALRAEPSLAEIFEIPALTGEAPRVRSISAGGRWMLVEWHALERDERGKRRLSESAGAYLVPTETAGVELNDAARLSAHLERAERAAHTTRQRTTVVAELEGWKPAQTEAFAWSKSGEVLAVAWEHAVVLLDMAHDDADLPAHYRVLYKDPPQLAADAAPSTTDAPAAQSVADEPAPWPERLGEVDSLSFSDDDVRLHVRTSDELFDFPLHGPEPFPLRLSDAQWPSRALTASTRRVQWSRDRRACFSDTPLAKIESSNADGTKLETDAQFFDVESGRKLALEGMKDIATLEDASLSPDGRFVFGCAVDRSKQPAPTLIPNYLSERVTTIEGRRDQADEPWPARTLWMWSTSDGTRKALELPGESALFNDIGWSPCEQAGVPARFAFRRVANDFRIVETWVWSEGETKLLLTELDAHWVGGPGSRAHWNVAGTRLLFASEGVASSTTPGHNEVFELDALSGAVTQVTRVEGEVESFDELPDGSIVFCASRRDPAQRELGRAERDARSGAWSTHWYSVPSGMNTSPRASTHGDVVVFTHGELGLPDELWRTGRNANCARLTHTIPNDFSSRAWLLPEKLALRHADGTDVRSHVYLPRATSLAHPDRARACVVFIHGAGYLQNVTDSMTEYAVNLMFHSRLASMGYVVVDVDYRGSAGYGSEFRGAVQFQLGKLELADIALVVDELARRGVIDAQRIGCYGGSYGGFLTLMALFTEPERWSCGAALRSVTDWRTYHPGYTQPRLGRPSTHPDAYRASSPIDHAAGLRDPLLILHGMVDTNVFAQDSIRLIETLIDLGKDFDAMLYPSQGHGFEDGAHWIDEYGRIERFMLQHLGAP